jgi:hypothetical protein
MESPMRKVGPVCIRNPLGVVYRCGGHPFAQMDGKGTLAGWLYNVGLTDRYHEVLLY